MKKQDRKAERVGRSLKGKGRHAMRLCTTQAPSLLSSPPLPSPLLCSQLLIDQSINQSIVESVTRITYSPHARTSSLSSPPLSCIPLAHTHTHTRLCFCCCCCCSLFLLFRVSLSLSDRPHFERFDRTAKAEYRMRISID